MYFIHSIVLQLIAFRIYFTEQSWLHPAGHKKRFLQVSWRHLWMLSGLHRQLVKYFKLFHWWPRWWFLIVWWSGDWKADVFRPDLKHRLYFKTSVSRPWVFKHCHTFVHIPRFGDGEPGVSLSQVLIYLLIFQFCLNLYLIVTGTKHNPISKFCNNLLSFVISFGTVQGRVTVVKRDLH